MLLRLRQNVSRRTYARRGIEVVEKDGVYTMMTIPLECCALLDNWYVIQITFTQIRVSCTKP